jgi:hypothetical protein
MHDLSELLSALGARRSDPQHPVWDIRAPGLFQHIVGRQRVAAFVAARSELLRNAVLHRQAINLITGEAELLTVPGVVSGRDNGHYLLKPEVDIGAVDETALQLGGWYLYACRVPEDAADVLKAFQSSDVFRLSAADLVQLLVRLKVSLLIASFYDDHEWRVAAPA